MRGTAKTIICAFALAAVAIMSASVRPALSADILAVKAAVIRVDVQKPLPISRLDLPPDDLGFVGGQLATADNQTTGRFTGQAFETIDLAVASDQAVAEAQRLVAEGVHYIVMAAEADKAAAAAEPVVIVQSSSFSVGSFLLGVLCTLIIIGCYSIQTDADPYLFDAPLGECVRDSAHRNKKLCAKDC